MWQHVLLAVCPSKPGPVHPEPAGVDSQCQPRPGLVAHRAGGVPTDDIRADAQPASGSRLASRFMPAGSGKQGRVARGRQPEEACRHCRASPGNGTSSDLGAGLTATRRSHRTEPGSPSADLRRGQLRAERDQSEPGPDDTRRRSADGDPGSVRCDLHVAVQPAPRSLLLHSPGEARRWQHVLLGAVCPRNPALFTPNWQAWIRNAQPRPGTGCASARISSVGTPRRHSTWPSPLSGTTQGAALVAAVLPSSRSVQVGVPATAFTTVINPGASTATASESSLNTGIPVNFTYQTTDPAYESAHRDPQHAGRHPGGGNPDIRDRAHPNWSILSHRCRICVRGRQCSRALRHRHAAPVGFDHSRSRYRRACGDRRKHRHRERPGTQRNASKTPNE